MISIGGHRSRMAAASRSPSIEPGISTSVNTMRMSVRASRHAAFDLQATVSMLTDIASRLSPKESTRMADADRFCPYVLLRNVEAADLATLKNTLWNRGIVLADGHAFLGAEFDATHLATLPRAGHVTKLKFLASEDDAADIAKIHKGKRTDVYDFYVDQPIATKLPSWVLTLIHIRGAEASPASGSDALRCRSSWQTSSAKQLRECARLPVTMVWS